MPVIRVEMFKRTVEQKRELVKALSDSFVKTCGGDKEDWASGGVLISDKENE